MAQFAAAACAVALTAAACGGNTASPPSTVTVTKSAPNVPSWTASAPSSIATAPSTATQAASGQITIPDLTGQNAKIAEDKLEALGFTNVELASATSKYQNVFVPANWTVVGIEPPAGTTVNAGDTVVVKVTKP
jgi:hypothetical protein